MPKVTMDMLVGAKISKVRRMTEEEVETIYGDDSYGKPLIIELDNGVQINAQADEENNGPGVFAFFCSKTGAEAYEWDIVE